MISEIHIMKTYYPFSSNLIDRNSINHQGKWAICNAVTLGEQNFEFLICFSGAAFAHKSRKRKRQSFEQTEFDGWPENSVRCQQHGNIFKQFFCAFFRLKYCYETIETTRRITQTCEQFFHFILECQHVIYLINE